MHKYEGEIVEDKAKRSANGLKLELQAFPDGCITYFGFK
jgi:hypothetical protein